MGTTYPLYGIGITTSNLARYFISFADEITEQDFFETLPQMKDLGINITCYQMKKMLSYSEWGQESAIHYDYDVELAAYLLDPLKGKYSLADMVDEYLGVASPHLTDGSSVPFDMEQSGKAAATQSMAIFLLREKLERLIEQNGMTPLYRDIEIPLVYTLYDMERHGIRVNKEMLAEYGVKLDQGIMGLAKDIYSLTGEDFNISSPKQLGVILFDKLKLPYGKKKKTGYSTSADILAQLAGLHPVVDKILEYRQLTKLKSTYVEGLANYIGEDGRIHGTFNQTVTATGRLSSTDPNLQNIPIRLELGRQIRKVFIPEDGYIFIDADYSQIELRILAHMSGDRQLIEAYNAAQDIHRITASQVFNLPLDDVGNELRNKAKAVNFGIIYGISSFGLGQGLNIPKREAQRYIEQYFKTYPRVKEFLDELIDEGRATGYVTTMYGRKRPVRELNSNNFQVRSAQERMAMNSPIQGTAADIIKIAMNRVADRFKRERMRSRLILQVHDELLVEAHVEEREQARRILLEEMQGAANLSVRLEVDIKEGMNWFDAK